MGGVVGLSFPGLSVLPLSSVMPGPLETFCSMPDAFTAAGDDVDCPSLALKRCLFPETDDEVECADLRLDSGDGGEYECGYGWTAD